MPNDELDIETDDDTGERYARIPEKDAVAQRDLARKAKENEAAAAERDAAQRELAFLKAGINPDESKVAALFAKSYDGELTAEAIKAAYADLGITTTTETTTTTELTPEQQAAAEAEAKQTQERADLARGAANSGVLPDKHPHDTMREAIENARKAGASEPVAQSAGLSQLVQAAAAGDKRVLAPGSATVG